MPADSTPSKLQLWLELLGVFCILPLVCWRAKLPVILALLVACVFVAGVMVRDASFDRRCLKSFPASRQVWLRIFLVWLCMLPLLAGFVWWLQPDLFFDFPRQKTKLWLLVMFAYPLISVVPQEIIYRAFFCHRYAPLFGRGSWMMLASATVFAFAHIVFGNPIAVVLTFGGGWLFVRTFLQTKSLPCVAVQHSIYGCAIFTVGLGTCFFNGTTRFMETFMNK